MKKLRTLSIIALTVALLWGCTDRIQPEITDATPSQTETKETDKKTDVIECAEAEGFITASSKESNTPCQIYMKKYRNDQPDYISYDLYIEVNTGSQILKRELISDVLPHPGSNVYLGDVDGDSIQEILVHQDTGGIGGFGLWYTWVLKVADNEIRVLFENFNEFDTGFSSRFLEGYQAEIKNNITGYTLVYDVKDGLREYLDVSDKLPELTLLLDPFYVFEPQDLDDDGISEILCKQYTSYRGHADYMGNACSVLQFNTQTQAFEVIDAWYEPYTEK